MNKEIKIAGNKIFYRSYGKGKPVMLVHGFGETGEVWKNQVDFLKGEFRLIVPDLPGSGHSDLVDDMSIEGMADVLKLILDKEVTPQTHPKEKAPPDLPEGEAYHAQGQLVEDSGSEENFQLSESSKVSPPVGGRFRGAKSSKIPPSGGGGAMIGHSMGGYITLAFAAKYPSDISAFGLFHSSAYADSDEKKAMRQKGIDFVNKHGAFEFFKNSTPGLFSPVTKAEKPKLIDEFLRGLNNFSDRAVVSYYEAMMKRPDRTEVLRTTSLPVLFVIGEYDAAVPVQDSLELSHLPEKSYIHILHHAGHMGMLEEVKKSNDLLKIFLSET